LRNKILIFFIFLIISLNSTENYRFLNLGIFYPLTMNRTKKQAVNINLSLIQNSVGNVKGVNLCGFSAVCHKNMNGLQGSLLYSQINDNLNGMSFSTLNFVNDNINGVQIGIAANLTGGTFKGAQASGIVNFVGGDFFGYQNSAVYNVVGKSFRGVQSGGIGNVVGNEFYGLQIGSIFNFTAKKMQGMQWGGVNIAGELRGLQMGYINLVQKNHGWQVGLLNIAEEQNGVPVGLVNLSDDGNVQWLNYTSNFSRFITGVRFLSGNAVSSIEIGGPEHDSEFDESGMIGFHYGYRIPWRNFGAEADFGYFHITNKMEDSDDLIQALAVQIRLSVTCQITKWLGITTGVGKTARGVYEEDTEPVESNLYFAGITLF